jgi:hypothetical protein
MLNTTCLALVGWLLAHPSPATDASPLGALTVDWQAETHIDTIRVRRPGSPVLIRSWEGEPLDFAGLEPGTYVVEARGAWWSSTTRVRLGAGESRAVVFEARLEEPAPLIVQRFATCEWCHADAQRAGASRPSTIARVGQ